MTEYQSNFNELLQHSLLTTYETPPKPNILEIGRSVKELTISNLYAYFLNPNENHGLDKLFLEALENILSKNEKPISIDTKSIRVRREQQTEERNFVDIVIDDGKSALIIENKLYASVYNNLDDYFDSFKYESKVGVVLAINNYGNIQKNYVSISHQEYCEEIGRLFEYKTNEFKLNDRQTANYYTFIENLKNHYHIVENLNEKIIFINTYKEQIDKLNQMLFDVKQSFLNQFKHFTREVLEHTVKFTVEKKNSLSFKVNNLPIMGYVFTDSESINSISFALWIAKDEHWVKEWHNHRSDKFTAINNKFGDSITFDRKITSKYWTSICYKTYYIENDNFGQLVSQFEKSLRTEWIEILKDLEKVKDTLSANNSNDLKVNA